MIFKNCNGDVGLGWHMRVFQEQVARVVSAKLANHNLHLPVFECIG